MRTPLSSLLTLKRAVADKEMEGKREGEVRKD